MTRPLSVRVTLVGVLAVCGVGLAVIGTTFGVGVGAPGSEAERITITDDSVTVSDGSSEAVAIEDLSAASTVAVTAHEDRVAIETEGPFDDEDRQQAIAIARANETVSTELSVERYEFRTQPIEKLSVDRSMSVNFTVEDDAPLGDDVEMGEKSHFNVSISEDEQNETVTVDRETEYIEEVLQVTAVDPETDERRVSVRVDLQNETVEAVTDWNEQAESETA